MDQAERGACYQRPQGCSWQDWVDEGHQRGKVWGKAEVRLGQMEFGSRRAVSQKHGVSSCSRSAAEERALVGGEEVPLGGVAGRRLVLQEQGGPSSLACVHSEWGGGSRMEQAETPFERFGGEGAAAGGRQATWCFVI